MPWQPRIDTRRGWEHWVAAVGLLLMSQCYAAESGRHGKGGAPDAPRVERQGGISVVTFPESFLLSVREQFPGFRIPRPEEVGGLWRPKADGEAPRFVTWGDYNGDGRNDIAILLLSSEAWKFVLFEKGPKGFRAAYSFGGRLDKLGSGVVDRAEDIALQTHPRGTELVFNSLGETFKFKFDVDALTCNFGEQGETLINWKEGRYESHDFGD